MEKTDNNTDSHSNNEDKDEVPDSQLQMIKYKNQYAIEAWYESIKEHTYKTEFLELSQDECRAIVNWYNDHIRAAKLKKEIVDNENDKKILEKLKERIEDKIQVLEASKQLLEFFLDFLTEIEFYRGRILF